MLKMNTCKQDNYFQIRLTDPDEVRGQRISFHYHKHNVFTLAT